MRADFDAAQDEYWADTVNLRPYDHPVVRAFATQRVEFLNELLGSPPPNTALDVGCGDGFGMHYMKRVIKDIHGCDRSRRMLDANPASAEDLTQCDAYDLPWPDNSFELVYCWELLHHLADPKAAVVEMSRVASRCVIVCEPNTFNPAMAAFGVLMRHERGSLRFNPVSTKRLLTNAGLRGVTCHAVGYFTPNRTPEALARALVRLPYRVPLIGLYTAAMGYKVTEREAGSATSDSSRESLDRTYAA